MEGQFAGVEVVLQLDDTRAFADGRELGSGGQLSVEERSEVAMQVPVLFRNELFPCLYSMSTVTYVGGAETALRAWCWSIRVLQFMQSVEIRQPFPITVFIFSTSIKPAIQRSRERGRSRKKRRREK